MSRRGPWGSRRPPYDPRDDGFGPDGYKSWTLKAVLICSAVAGVIAWLGWLLG